MPGLAQAADHHAAFAGEHEFDGAHKVFAQPLLERQNRLGFKLKGLTRRSQRRRKIKRGERWVRFCACHSLSLNGSAPRWGAASVFYGCAQRLRDVFNTDFYSRSAV